MDAQAAYPTIEIVLRLFLASLSAILALTLLSACTPQDVQKKSSEQSSSASQQATEKAPAFLAGGTASENEKYVNYILRKSIRDGVEINGVNAVNTLANAGFDKAAMQVSFDESRTGLAADNIFVSVRVNADCLIGQIVASDKTVTTSVQPAVGPDKTVCLIGQTRPIDW